MKHYFKNNGSSSSNNRILEYCPFHESLWEVWVQGGISHCFLDTVIASLSLGLTFVCVIQLFSYSKRIKRDDLLPRSQLYHLQIALHVILPLVSIAQIAIEGALLKESINGGIYGSLILLTVQSIIVWPISCFLVIRERHFPFLLKGEMRKRHSFGLIVLWTWAFAANNLILLNIRNPHWFFLLRRDPPDIPRLLLFILQYAITAGIFVLGWISPGLPGKPTSRGHGFGFRSHAHAHTHVHARNGASTPLLSKNGIPQFKSYTNLSDHSEESGSGLHTAAEEEEEQQQQKEAEPEDLISKMRVLLPFIWPKSSILYQTYAFICVGLLVAGRFANTYVPIYSKHIVDSMSLSNTTSVQSDEPLAPGKTYQMIFRWDYVLIYVGLKLTQGGVAGTGGLIGSINTMLWMKVQQFTTKGLEVHLFEHLHSLSHSWHMRRETGAVLRAMDRGTDSFNYILNYFIFNIIPTLVDVVVAIVYFTAVFNPLFGFIVFLTVAIYLFATFTMTEYRTKVTRARNQADNELKQMCLDSLLNFETIKDYANLDYEKEAFQQLMSKFQEKDALVQVSISLNDVIQLFVINIGLLIGSMLCVHAVVADEGLTIGDYVLFAAYLIQLFEPLNNFGKYYKSLQRYFVDTEHMLDVLLEEQEIKDDPHARTLQVHSGHVEFRNVSFHYLPERKILKDISFSVPPGTTVALVGPSGGGKTSIVRLLLHFYNPSSGEILIDGQNIQQVTLKSLRKNIGVVPQDTVLFNATLKHNIAYGRLDATDDEIIEACKVACIHDRFMTFPQGYQTKVGERGLRLSGGEKQRVAIARSVLKNPPIILLDEATSALDSCTERAIQGALQALCERRTSIVVAHRLTTIVNADQILVISEGRIIERGSHSELLQIEGGMYANMWNEQLQAEAPSVSPSIENSTEFAQ